MTYLVASLLTLACAALSLNTGNECQAPGIRGSQSSSKFIVCVEKDGALLGVEHECSKGLKFDVVRKTCTRIFSREVSQSSNLSPNSEIVVNPDSNLEVVNEVNDTMLSYGGPYYQLAFPSFPLWPTLRPKRPTLTVTTGTPTQTPTAPEPDYSTTPSAPTWTPSYSTSSSPTTWPPTTITTTSTATTASPQVTRPCKGAGAFCSNCDTLSFCVAYNLPTGERLLKNILDLPCNPSAKCVKGQGCVKISNGGLCREGPFVCGDVGLYPDLYDCKMYHICTVGINGQLVDTPISCSGGVFGDRWNPLTSTCGWPENDSSCIKYPVPTCTAPLEMGPVAGQIYSICVEDDSTHTLTPRLFRCPQDFVFNATNFSCERPI